MSDNQPGTEFRLRPRRAAPRPWRDARSPASGFGTMQLEHAAAGRDAALAVLRQAVHEGVNHLDTAQFYGAAPATGSSATPWRPTRTTWSW